MKRQFSLKRIVKIVSMLLAVVVTTVYLQQFILLHYDSNRLRIKGFYVEEQNTIDVALIGSSDVYASFAPGMAYDKYGFTSYDYASASVTCTAALTQLKEVVSRQSPKLILMEVNAFLYGATKDGEDSNAVIESSVRNYIDNIPMNDNKKEFINEYVDKDLQIEYYLPFIKYHSAWNDYPQALRYLRACFEQEVRGYTVLKGFKTRTRIFKPLKELYNTRIIKDDKKAPLSPPAEKELKNLLDYCKKNDIRIAFFRSPHLIEELTVTRAERSNTIEEIITEAGFDFYNFERNYMDIGIDPKLDFYNYDHLNIYGCEKFTGYLSKLIVEKYRIGRTELSGSQKEQWDKAAKSFRKLYDYSDEMIRVQKKYVTLEENAETIEVIT